MLKKSNGKKNRSNDSNIIVSPNYRNTDNSPKRDKFDSKISSES